MRARTSSLALMAALAFTSSLRAQNVALVADHLYTMDAGPQGGPGLVLIRDGKIQNVRQGANVQPPKDFQVIRGAYVTPGLIDADTTTGVSGAYNIPADQDEDESSEPNTADVNVRDSLNPEDLLYQYVNTYGVTTLQVTAGPRNPIAGRAGIFKTVGPQSPFPNRGPTYRPAQLGHGIQSGPEAQANIRYNPQGSGHAYEDGGDDPRRSAPGQGIPGKVGQVEAGRK